MTSHKQKTRWSVDTNLNRRSKEKNKNTSVFIYRFPRSLTNAAIIHSLFYTQGPLEGTSKWREI